MPRPDHVALTAGSADTMAKLEHQIQHPIPSPNHPSKIVEWIVLLFNLLLDYLHVTHDLFNERIHDLEAFVPPLPSIDPKSRSNPVRTPSAAPRRPSRRCAECHASGHVDTECRTKDPTVMRKRVAANQKRKKAARTAPSIPLPFPTPSFSHPAFYGYQPTSNPQALMAMATDAEELRRRRQQSNRDKRARRSAIPTT